MDPKLKITLVIIGIIIVFLVTEFTMAKISYKPTLDWWANNNGENYSDQFSILNCMLSYYSSLLYFLNKMTLTPQQVLDLDQIAFLVGDIFPYQRFIDANGNQNGLLVPRHICESVLLKYADGDQLFINWYNNETGPGGFQRNEDVSLVYGPPTTTPIVVGNATYQALTFGLPTVDPATGAIGVYPANGDTNSWMGLIADWAGGPNGDVLWQADESNRFYSPEIKPGVNSQDASALNWFNWKNTGAPRPDNFLARMGIPPDSPLVVYFCTGKYSIGGMPVDASALLNLLGGSGPNAGGWVGYVQGRQGVTRDDYRNYIYTKVDWLGKPPKICNPSNQTQNTAFAATGSVISTGLMCLPFMTNPIGIFFGLAAIATMGAISGVKASQASASNC